MKKGKFILYKIKYSTCLTFISALLLIPTLLFGQNDSLSADELKKLSLEELMNIEVTSVSRRPEDIREVASAIQVITQQDIHNSGVKTLPEALRLASNLQVAQVNASQWAISARGFTNVLANKLLVLIDGRTVYTPLYAGVFWDIQNLILEDIDRIEVISGPGGTQWGANAVNGVINIITKSSKETRGIFAEAVTGSSVDGLGSVRYGGSLSEDITFRLYGTGFKMGNTLEANTGLESKDQWSSVHGGFQVDWALSEKSNLTLQQNIYKTRPNPNAIATVGKAIGDNTILRWNKKSSDTYDFQLQAYYDYTERRYPTGLGERLRIYDLDWDNRLKLGGNHMLSFGANIRIRDHEVDNLPLTKFLPDERYMNLYSLFLQDQISFADDKIRFTLGSKFEHNNFTGIEIQPSARLSIMASNGQRFWAAVSRSVKTPSRLDEDIAIFANPSTIVFSGGEDFKSETVVAYELGWRSQPMENVSISLSTFYNQYDFIRSAEPPVPPAVFPSITLGNGVKGNTYGAELAGTYKVNDWWYLKGGYTVFRKDLKVKPTSRDLNRASAESNDPGYQLQFQSNVKLGRGFDLGATYRYIDNLPRPYVPAYGSLDLRLGLKFLEFFEFNLVGQNLLDDRHREFIPSAPSARQIERGVYGRLTFRY